jgi:hypothetical protein
MVVREGHQVDIVMEIQEVVVQEYRVKDLMVVKVVDNTIQVEVEVLVQLVPTHLQDQTVVQVNFQVY